MTQCTPTCENGMCDYIKYFIYQYNSDANILAVGGGFLICRNKCWTKFQIINFIIHIVEHPTTVKVNTMIMYSEYN
jgi:hypothetical protein